MKTQILLISILCMFTWSVQAQAQQRKATLPSGPERAGRWFNSPQPGFKPDHMVVPSKRNMFDSSGYVWKWDTIMCYNLPSGDIPFQRATRTYNSFGEQLTILYERRQGSLAWENYAREADAYDSAGNWVDQLQEVWQNNAWVNFQKQEFVYDANGNQVDWKRKIWDSTSWDNWWHYYNHFNASGLQDTGIFQQGQDSLWLNNQLWIPSYDGNGYLTSSISYSWLNNNWEVSSRDSSTYNANGNLLTYLRQNWINSLWVNTSFQTASWDPAGNCLSSLYQLWQNNAWENNNYYVYTYDPAGNKVMETWQNWYNGAWVNGHRILYDYDTSINLLSETSQDWVNAAWRNAYTTQYTYDSWGNSLTGKVMHWGQPYDGGLDVYANHERDMVLQGEMYRYAAVIDSIMVSTEPGLSQGQVTLYPNPAQSRIYISSPASSPGSPGSVSLSDIRGQLVLTKQIVNETTGIDVSGLTTGVYFVRFSDNWMTRVLKFVKD
ncbi:MAG: T9SS type A sorting domain-containing protein [Bacteroidetes bacterium]|nr:T9SS type A sorting domain-containing protein [Bacteroidota bacterium]